MKWVKDLGQRALGCRGGASTETEEHQPKPQQGLTLYTASYGFRGSKCLEGSPCTA